jgi:hypothetical protein
MIRVVAEPQKKGIYSLGIRVDGSGQVLLASGHSSPSPGEADSFTSYVPWYMPGDVNEDWLVNSSDIVYLINYLFVAGPLPVPTFEAGDINCDGEITSADTAYLINYLFIGGPPPGC